MDGARTQFDRQLKSMRDDILQLADMVDTAIELSMDALKEQDVDLAQQVVDGDERINQLRYDVEETALTLLATQQPIARDLRSIVAAIHIVTELERMGDYASGVAELAVRLSEWPLLKPLIDLPRMAAINREMIQNSLEAYVERDVNLAVETAKRDAEIDGLYDQIYRELLTYMMQDPSTITRATYLLWVTHNMERIADRVTNICERVVFMTTGEMQEFNY